MYKMDLKKDYVLRSVVCYFCNEQFPEEQLQVKLISIPFIFPAYI